MGLVIEAVALDDIGALEGDNQDALDVALRRSTLAR